MSKQPAKQAYSAKMAIKTCHLLAAALASFLILPAASAQSALNLIDEGRMSQALSLDQPAATVTQQENVISLNAEQVSQLEYLILNEPNLPQNPSVYYVFADIAQAAYTRGDVALALDIYERLIAEYPDWPRPKLDAALIYLNQNNKRRAKQLLESQLSMDDPEQVRLTVLGLLRRIEQSNPWYTDFGMALVPDNNVNNATFNETVALFGGLIDVVLDEDSRPQEDLYLYLEGKVGLRVPVSDRVRLRLELEADSSSYVEFEEYNRFSVGFNFIHEYRLSPSSNLSTRLYVRNAYEEDGKNFQQKGFNTTLFKSWGGNCWASLTPGFERGKDIDNNDRSYQNYSANVAFSPCLEAIYFQLGTARHDANIDLESYRQQTFGIGYTPIQNDRLDVQLNALYQTSKFDGLSPSAINELRRDDRYTVSAKVGVPNFRVLGFYYPSVTLRYSRNDSNYDFYENNKFQAFLEFEREY